MLETTNIKHQSKHYLKTLRIFTLMCKWNYKIKNTWERRHTYQLCEKQYDDLSPILYKIKLPNGLIIELGQEPSHRLVERLHLKNGSGIKPRIRNNKCEARDHGDSFSNLEARPTKHTHRSIPNLWGAPIVNDIYNIIVPSLPPTSLLSERRMGKEYSHWHIYPTIAKTQMR